MSPMNSHHARPTRFPWPPVIVVASFLAGFALHHLVPVFDHGSHPRWAELLGAVVAACGLGIDLWATKTLFNNRTTVFPNRGARQLVGNGPFRWTRNPIYLGYVLLIGGVGIGLGNAWLIALSFVTGFVIQKLSIEPEERHLRAVFGPTFESYCRQTRRWL